MMTYSFSYHLPNDYIQHDSVHLDNYNNHMRLYGLKEIAAMINRDFKYNEYGIDNWSGSKQYRIELVVFSREQWTRFIKMARIYLEPWQIKKLREELAKIENENKQSKDTDNNRV